MKVHLNRKLPIRIIFFLYFVYFVMSYMGGEWTFSNSKYGMMPIYTHTVNNLRLIYLLFILILGAYELLLQFKQKNISQIDMLLFVIFLFASFIHLYTVSQLTDTQTLLFQSGTPMMYLVFLAYFVGMDDKAEKLLQKAAKAYGLVFLAFTMIYFLIFCMDVGYSFGVKFSSGPILYSFNNGFFLIVYTVDITRTKTKRIIIEDGAFIGGHSIILKGTHIGENSVIGAGSVVAGNIPANEIWAGNPARFIKKIKDVMY